MIPPSLMIRISQPEPQRVQYGAGGQLKIKWGTAKEIP
jgi:hypothetical protein